MNKIDTISLLDSNIVVYNSANEDISDSIFRKNNETIYFQISEDVYVSLKTIINMHSSDMFRFEPFVQFPDHFEDEGSCVYCDCYTNVGFRLLNVEGILCSLCLKNIVKECLAWIQDNPSVSAASVL